jgi:hypothetical protein
MEIVMKFTTNRQQDRAFRAEVLEALKGVAAKHGIKFELGNGKVAMDGSYLHMQLKAAVLNADGTVETEEAKAFRLFAPMTGMKVEWLGKVFTAGGIKHTITGFRSKASKKPVTTKGSDGKNYVWPTQSVIVYMGRQG